MHSASISADHTPSITVIPSLSLLGPPPDAQDPPNVTCYHADRDPNVDPDQDAVQVLSPPSNPPTRQDWEAYRTIFTQLYRSENKTLKEVRSIMMGQYGFKATPRMFKKRVIDWKLQKNYKATEREAVARVVEKCRNHGDPSPTVLLRGQPVKKHRIQRHCNIRQSLTVPFRSAGYFASSVLDNDAGQIQPRGPSMEYDKETYGTPTNNLQEMADLITITLRQLSPPDELKHVELILFQTNIFYEWYALSIINPDMKRNGARESLAEIKVPVCVRPGYFANKVSAALSSLNLNQRRAGWRLLNEAMDIIRPMLLSKNPYTLRVLIREASEWEALLPPDFYRVIWGQITETASIVLGDSDPLAKVCLAITQIKSKGHVYENVIRLLRSIFERTLGPYHCETLQLKSDHVRLLLNNQDFAVAECLQRNVISDFEEHGDRFLRGKSVPYEVYQLGCILLQKRDFSGAKKVFRDALRLGREGSEDRFPTQVDLYSIDGLVSTLAEYEYSEVEVLLQEALEKCLKNEHWGRHDWHTVSVLGSLENLLKKQGKLDEAGILRLQYPEAF